MPRRLLQAADDSRLAGRSGRAVELLEEALERADGMTVLRARGVESESELPFAGLSDLFRPVLDRLKALPELGAMPWADGARTELRATGETPRRRDPSAAEQLTPQELQVALVVARGATNKEAGAALFLSPKTIEAHLGRIYRKLGSGRGPSSRACS